MYINETNFKWNGSLSYNNHPNKIILHHAESTKCTVEDIHQWHLEKNWVGIGYHYVVRKDGSIYRGRPEGASAAQCPGQNSQSIGICAEGKYDSETMPQAQYNAIVELIQDIKNRHGNMPVYGHRELYETDCPGTNYPLQKFKDGTKLENQKVYVVSQYLPGGYHGQGDFEGIDVLYVNQFMCDVRWYLRTNSYGQWIETEMLTQEKAAEVKNSLSSWFCEFRTTSNI